MTPFCAEGFARSARTFEVKQTLHGPVSGLGLTPLLVRVWELRKNLTAYDAMYVALAKAIDGVLFTCDRRLSRAPGMSRRVSLIRD